jgi:hypothetical protein
VRVVIWLGVEDPDAGIAIPIIEKVFNMQRQELLLAISLLSGTALI